MPYRPAKPCRYPGCPALTHERFCATHAKVIARQYEQYERDPATAKRYAGEWRKVRAAYLSAHPLCEICARDNRLTPAALVHHKVKLSDGGGHSPDNLMALCSPCHSRLHAQQGDRWGTRPGG
jgi:5-methylcytosine-specific restriction protein A